MECVELWVVLVCTSWHHATLRPARWLYNGARGSATPQDSLYQEARGVRVPQKLSGFESVIGRAKSDVSVGFRPIDWRLRGKDFGSPISRGLGKVKHVLSSYPIWLTCVETGLDGPNRRELFQLDCSEYRLSVGFQHNTLRPNMQDRSSRNLEWSNEVKLFKREHYGLLWIFKEQSFGHLCGEKEPQPSH